MLFDDPELNNSVLEDYQTLKPYICMLVLDVIDAMIEEISLLSLNPVAVLELRIGQNCPLARYHFLTEN